MCIIIDVNSLPPVFSGACAKHPEFAPVMAWIDAGLGVAVIGGTKYKAELAKAGRYLRLIRLMRDGGKAIYIRDEAVDHLEEKIRTKTRRTACNDQHIIALLGASHCPLLCSADALSFRFVKKRSLYPKGMPRVKVYTSSRNRALLVPMNKMALTNVET
jgi:hypothetical protein